MIRTRLAALAAPLLAGASLAGAAAAQPALPSPGCTTPAVRTDPEPTLRFGCATEANLRAMIADPADLERGRASTPPQGDAAFAAAERRRLDQVKPLAGTGQGGAGATGAGAAAQPAKGY